MCVIEEGKRRSVCSCVYGGGGSGGKREKDGEKGKEGWMEWRWEGEGEERA